MPEENKPLTLAELHEANLHRYITDFHFDIKSWTSVEWGNMMMGECSASCNVISKQLMENTIDTTKISNELANIIIHADLLAARLGISLDDAVRNMFNEFGRQNNFSSKL